LTYQRFVKMLDSTRRLELDAAVATALGDA
jgi:hypothetical protein